MDYVNSLDENGVCAKQGYSAENLFYNILVKRGEVRKSTAYENKKHVDFFLLKDGITTTFDVKARKKISRNDNGLCDEFVWVEILNIYGNVGWAFSPNVNFFAFEREKDFILVSQPKLQKLIEEICNLTSMVTSSKKALYCAYRRFGRKDMISLIKMSDLEAIASEILLK